MTTANRALSVALAALALSCAEGEPDAGPAPRPLSEAGHPAPPAAQQARTIAGNPRLLLFDLQTALEGVRETRGAYPSIDEFRATESWALQRAALDAAFDEWAYESDAETYALSGEAGGRTFEIRSPR